MVVIACRTLKNEIELAMNETGQWYPIIWVESGLHEWPQRLHTHLQEIIDGLPYETALLAFGFCGNSAVGLYSSRTRLILPRVADCITLFLGSNQRREQIGNSTYFFTEGYLSGERNLIAEYAQLLEKYDVQTASWLMREMMKHYKRLAVIDTGVFDVALVSERVRGIAELLEIPVETVKGDAVYFHELLFGPWSEERFLIVEPGKRITLEDSLSV